jgi:hypothetical protein
VLFFDRKPASERHWTDTLWIYDLRTNQHFTLKERPLFDYRIPSRRGTIDAKSYAELSRLILDFRNFGSNVNQLAHNLNLGLPVAVQQALQSIVEAREALDRLRLQLVQVAEDFEAPEQGSETREVLGDIWEED